MAETTYNVTYEHTSPWVNYGGIAWYADCPVTNGEIICGDGSGNNVQGYHFANQTSASFEIYFYGKSLYLYGDADSGMTLTLSINFQETPMTLSPSNGMLASIDDFTAGCTSVYLCGDNSASDSTSTYNYNTAKVTATQYVTGAKVSFVKAVFELPTHRSGATTSIKTYQNTDPAIQYTTGWTHNGTYMQSGSGVAQQFNLAFDGPAIWVWQFCGDRSGFDLGSYGEYTLGGETDYSQTLFAPGPIPQDGKCLAYFRGNLPETGNTLVFNSDVDNCEIHSIDVLQVTGGTTFTDTTSSSGYGPTQIPTINDNGESNGTSKAVMIAVPVIVICLAVAAGIVIAILVRQSRKRTAAGAGFVPAGDAFMTPETKVGEPNFGTPTKNQGYLLYTPPPPATPMIHGPGNAAPAI